MAAASLTAQNVHSPIFAEKSKSGSCLTNQTSRGGDLGKSPRNSVESFGTGEKKIGSLSSETLCGVCRKGFPSKKAVFGHMWVHSSSKQRGIVQRDRKQRGNARSDRVASHVLQVSSVQVATSVRKSSPKEVLSFREIDYRTTRRKRSVRVRCSGNEPGNDVIHGIDIPKSALLSSGFSEDEIEAAEGLLMLSTGVGSWIYSYDGKNSSGFLQIRNEGQVLDELLLGVGNKRRKLCEADDATTPEILKVTGYDDSLSIDSYVKGKVMEYQISCDMISGQVDVRTFVCGGMVEEMRRLMVDVLEEEKIPDLRSDGEVEGGSKKKVLPKSDRTKGGRSFQRKSFKCRSCGRIFRNKLELLDHRLTNCCSSTEDEKMNGECTSSPSHANGPGTVLPFAGHGSKDIEATASERDRQGTLLLDLNVHVEVSNQENSIGSPGLPG